MNASALPSSLKTPAFALYKRLIRTYVWRYRRTLVLGGVCMLLVAASTGFNAYLLKPVFDGVFVNKDTSLLLLVPLALVMSALVNAVADYGSSLSLKYVGQRVVSDMQGDLFAHVMHSDISLFHDQSSGRLISRLTSDIMLMRQSVTQVLTGLIKECCTLIFLIGVMFLQSFSMSLIAFAILFFAVMPISQLGKRMRKVADATQSQLADFTAQLDDTFQGARVVKAYGRETFEAERARSTIRKLFKLYYKASRIQSAAAPIMNLLGGVAIAAIVWIGGTRIIAGDSTPGALVSFITAMVMAYRPVKVIANLNTMLQEGMAAAGRYFAVLDHPPGIADAPGAQPLIVTEGRIAVEELSFRYAEGAGGVDQLNFAVPAGHTVALVGASGSGKTTIMNLLLRFYDPQAGRITIDGVDIRRVTLASLRQAFALVSQDIVLFNDTVRANIAYGKLDATDAEITAAAEKAFAHEFIMQLPEGYDTLIGPSGVKLSGGQRQRLSIARAILKNAPILLLDEATSALDTASERAVQEALGTLMQGRTTLVIAHRLSTIVDADRILVLEGGHIQASGTHAELLATSDIYRTMHQLSNPEAAA